MNALTACLVLLCGLAAGAGSLSPAPGGGQGGSRALPAPRAELGPLAGYLGKFRLLILAAPGPSDTSYRLMEQQMDVKSPELRCQLAARDLLLLVLFQGDMGKVVTVSQEGEVSEDKLEAEGVAQIMRLLSLKEGQFNMVLLRKSMQLYERFPYAVRMEAVLETVDQMPLRKIESVTRRGQHLRCKGAGARRLGSGQHHTNNRSLLYRGMANRSLVNRGMVNRTLVNRGMVNRTLVNRGMVNRTLVNRGMVNRGMVNRTLVNRGMANRTLVNRGMVNRTLVNRGMVNRTTLNGMWRSASPYSKKPIRSQSVGSPGKPGLLAPHSSFPSGRTLGKQKGSAFTPNSVGKRRVESLRGGANPRESSTIPVSPGQETVESLMVQIREKVQQMLTAKHRNPVSRAGSHTYQRPQVQTKGSTSVMSTMSPLTQSATGQAWHSLPTSQTLENFSTVPTDLAHQRPESGHWDYGSPSTQASFPGLSTPSGQASRVTHPPEDPLIGSTLPKSPRVPATAQPTETWRHSKVRGALTQPSPNLSPQSERRGEGQRQENPESVPSSGRKEERKHRGNRKKKERKKNRKNRRNRKNKKNGSRNSKQIDNQELRGFLDHFRNKRRLLLITAPRENSKLYIHQRDEYLEHVCQLAVRRITMIAILGSQSNSTLKVEHYQNENELTLETPVSESVSVDLIAQLRRDFGMTFDEFFMVLVDYDMKVKQYFDVPIPVKVLVNYMDTLPSRKQEIQEEEKNGVTCVKRKQFNINKFISRLQWKRRLLIISSPSEEEWAFQQQVTALHGQACSLGIRHFILLKLVGSGEDSSGSLELFPLNGRSEVETEELSSIVVSGLREHFQISDEHFMMLLIGKDGTINSWYLSPMWSLATIYELVDSMQLRQEEMKLQKALGIYCLEDDSSPHYRGYPDHA
ncbi:coiled-coil domain-containing protein 80-like [Scyliorhinus canicula]|uniref:coiled-coil domain-containing protein 80-like n=1 Tax=Scyliorhinus canicula TaxID=7830 RepID=UPI0018F281F2|nr:coiled-coil domain-containing protein 80-like [Scyliorhinus canicula]